MSHLSHEELSAHLDGALPAAARASAERHLAECATCRQSLADLAAQEAELRPALEHDPGDAYFETFAARVEDRVRAAGLKGAQARLGGGGWMGWLRSPRRLAWAGAVAAVVAGAGIVMLTTRPQHSVFENPTLLQRSDQREIAPAAPGAPPPSEDQRLKKTQSNLATRAPAARPPESEGVGSEAQGKLEATTPVQAERDRDAGLTEESRAPAQAPAPTRAMEVRRAPSGEDVPVPRPGAGFAPPPAGSGQPVDLKAAKPKAAAPLAPSADALSEGKDAARLDQVAPSLCGRVVDDQGRPVAGAVVALADLGLTATAGDDGRFCMAAPTGSHQLTAMAVGYGRASLQVAVGTESSAIQVALKPVSVIDGRLSTGGGRTGEMAYRKEGTTQAAALTREAARLSTTAESLGTAAAFDAAAAAWARVVSATREAARLDAGFRAAEARHRAWRLSPTETRVRAARAALDAFLAEAPAGARRDQAAVWREQLR